MSELIPDEEHALARLRDIAEKLNTAKEFIHNLIDEPDELPDLKDCWELIHDARAEVLDVDHHLERIEAYYAGKMVTHEKLKESIKT